MPTRLLLLALTCLANAGCANRSSSVVANGDPFLAPAGTQVAVHDAAATPADTASPSGPQVRETASVVDNTLRGVDVDLATGETSISPPDRKEWWHTASAAQASAEMQTVMKDDIKVPDAASVNRRTGHFSINYGTGQISKP
jgi:hypothetical protein